MKTRAIILAGGEGTRLGVLTAKRSKPSVPFGGKYRIIDFTLSNCVNSRLFDVMIIAQYRPHSLIEHIGSGIPWDLDRGFTGGVRIYTPYKALASGWFSGTADAVQQNFSFIKSNNPDLILILSGDHVYTMDYASMIKFHLANQSSLTIATIEVPIEDAPRFGIIGIDAEQRVTAFVEKPDQPPSNLANMGVYLFNRELLDRVLWEDHLYQESKHDFGKDILPALVTSGERVFAYPYSGYWVDVGTVNSYWQAHMNLLEMPPPLDLYNRSWIIHTRTEERPPVKIFNGARIENSLICDGCIIEDGAQISNSILSPGVYIHSGTMVKESILFTDAVVEGNTVIERSILDKRVRIHEGTVVGDYLPDELQISMIGKNSIVPPKFVIEPGGMIGADVISSDYSKKVIKSGEFIQTRRLPNEV